MRPRSEFNSILENVVGGKRVYYQPPVNIQMKYPAIVYDREYTKVDRADNGRHITTVRYNVQLITTDPDDPIIEKLLDLPYSSQDRHYVSDRLHHYVFNIYY